MLSATSCLKSRRPDPRLRLAAPPGIGSARNAGRDCAALPGLECHWQPATESAAHPGFADCSAPAQATLRSVAYETAAAYLPVLTSSGAPHPIGSPRT